jgi:hypothetical protein
MFITTSSLPQAHAGLGVGAEETGQTLAALASAPPAAPRRCITVLSNAGRAPIESISFTAELIGEDVGHF